MENEAVEGKEWRWKYIAVIISESRAYERICVEGHIFFTPLAKLCPPSNINILQVIINFLCNFLKWTHQIWVPPIRGGGHEWGGFRPPLMPVLNCIERDSVVHIFLENNFYVFLKLNLGNICIFDGKKFKDD